jgi:NMD protein affecting ribosome stability and mRNA decay
VELDLDPIAMPCMRCGNSRPMRFYGLCSDCRAELHARFDRDARTIEVAEYEPKMNVTPNAVAVKDD